MIEKLAKHPLTDKGIEMFLTDWKKVPRTDNGHGHADMIGLIKKSFGRLPDLTEKGARLNFPNIITVLRVTVIPVLFFLLLSPGRDGSLIIAGLFILAALTDLLDGYIARKYEIVTVMGKFLDPIADKLIVNTAMILMIPLGTASLVGLSPS